MPARRPRITIDARYLRRPGLGISVYLAGFIGELAPTEFDVTLLTNHPAHAARLADEYDGIRADHLPDGRELTWEQRALPRYLRETRPDVYVAGANRGLPWRSPPDTRLVLIVHDLIPLRMPRTHLLPNPAGAGRFLLGTAISLARADLLVTNSRSTAAEVRRWRPHVPAAIRYPALSAAPPAGPGLPAGWPEAYLLYCGGADARKNVNELIAAHADWVRRGGELPLVIMGFGYDDLKRDLARDGKDGNLQFTGHVSEAVKWAALRAAQAVLYPSSWEGFGLPILEALAVGTPVLAGRGGAQPEVGGDAAAYVDPKDHEALVAGIAEVTSPAWRERARRMGPDRLAGLRAANRGAGEILGGLDAEGSPV